ncbi:MAG TPA: tetratricopeptide repeat protein [Burkholderiaceae bacterium]|jgi:tetratricopeptide (TPR) repeat protein|nr:tetratricopeptide repeat protein [Burkholderiaceae bacterium]
MSRVLGAAVTVLLAAGLAGPAPAQQPTQWSPWSTELVPAPRSEAAEIAELMQAGKSEQALKRADAYLADKPRDLQVRFLRAITLIDLGRRQEATDALIQLTQDFPELPEPYNNLAVLAAAQGLLEKAEELLRQALAAQPNYITAQENLGDLYVAMAAAAFERASKLDPANSVPKSKLALARDLVSKLKTAR